MNFAASPRIERVASRKKYRIAREGLCNAFMHARAAHVEAEITYGRGFSGYEFAMMESASLRIF